MPDGAWRPPESERALGLGFYATLTPPIPGRIKATPEDFEVRELSEYPSPDANGPFTILRIRSEDWEQHELAQRIARELRLPPHALSWAGTKDRRARSERLFSYRGPPPEGPIGLARVEVIEAYRARDGLSLGHHYGNAFRIRVSALAGTAPAAVGALEAVRNELRRVGGFPNFFGPQRFGEVRPVTHLVGRDLALGDPAAAVETYLTYAPPGSEGVGDLARRRYAADHDAARALKEFPPSYQFERRLLDHLARGHPPDRALRALSRELRMLFVHAYQALLFNRWLGARRDAGYSADAPIEGDRLLRVGADGTTAAGRPIVVSTDNLTEVRELVARGRALIAGPLVGFETSVDIGPAGELLRAVLEPEHLRPADLKLPHSPEIASAGGWRPAVVATPPIRLVPVADGEPSPGEGPSAPAIWTEFTLPKGSYATVLIREFLKTGASR